MATYEEAAEQLGINQSSIQRRMKLLGMRATIGPDRRADVDPEEIERRWQERLASLPRPEAQFTEPLVVSIRPDQRDAIDALVKEHDISIAAATRVLIDAGLEATRLD